MGNFICPCCGKEIEGNEKTCYCDHCNYDWVDLYTHKMKYKDVVEKYVADKYWAVKKKNPSAPVKKEAPKGIIVLALIITLIGIFIESGWFLVPGALLTFGSLGYTVYQAGRYGAACVEYEMQKDEIEKFNQKLKEILHSKQLAMMSKQSSYSSGINEANKPSKLWRKTENSN